MSQVLCPSCGAQQDRPDDQAATATCGTCGSAWNLDPAPRCGRCGSTDLAATPDVSGDAGSAPTYACYTCGGRDVTSADPQPPPTGV